LQNTYAGFWIRFVAYVIDGVLLGIAGSLLNESYVSVGLGWLYFSLMESSKYQGTLGKIVLNLKVADLKGNRITFGRATGRYFSKILSGLILCVGYMMIGWTQNKQGLHDIIAGTTVEITEKELIEPVDESSQTK
jgi:uncharacterized RDD family membrane protein YckC